MRPGNGLGLVREEGQSAGAFVPLDQGRLLGPRLLVGEPGGSPLLGTPVRPGRAGAWRSSGIASRALPDGPFADLGSDTIWTHDLERGPKLVRDDDRRNACSAAVSGFRSWSALGAHQSMLYYDI
jgi:hypothetical protein